MVLMVVVVVVAGLDRECAVRALDHQLVMGIRGLLAIVVFEA